MFVTREMANTTHLNRLFLVKAAKKFPYFRCLLGASAKDGKFPFFLLTAFGKGYLINVFMVLFSFWNVEMWIFDWKQKEHGE